jgi:di/tricarboxylate transporter
VILARPLHPSIVNFEGIECWCAGAASAIADLLMALGRALGGSAAIQISVYAATALLSNIVANNAAAALMFPIAISVAEAEGLDKDRMAFLLMLAASASFAVPFGYQTNLMVYGAGGYCFKDFVRFGGPLQVRMAGMSSQPYSQPCSTQSNVDRHPRTL